MSGPTTERERGSILILAIFVLVLVAVMGISLMFLSQNEVKMSQVGLAVKRSFYLAEAGIEDGRRKLFDVSGATDLTDDLQDAAGPNDSVDLSPDAIQALYADDGSITGFAGFGDDVSLTGQRNLGDGVYAAFLTNDPKEGIDNTTDGDRRVMLTSVGAGPRGQLEVVQAILEPIYLLPDLPLSTISMFGPTPDFEGGNSNAATYSGSDCQFYGGGTPGLYVPVLGTVGSNAEASAEGGVDGNPTYTSGGVSPLDTIADLTDLTEPLVGGALDPTWTDCAALHEVVEILRDQATYVCNGSSCNLPATNLQSISFLGGANVTLGPGFVGSGLLVATGQVTFQGNTSWDGLLFVVGAGVLHRDGGGNGRISGTTIVADIAGPDNLYGTADDCTGGPAGDGFDIASYTVSGAGGSDIDYCSDLLAVIRPVRTYQVVDFLQR